MFRSLQSVPLELHHIKVVPNLPSHWTGFSGAVLTSPV